MGIFDSLKALWADQDVQAGRQVASFAGAITLPGPRSVPSFTVAVPGAPPLLRTGVSASEDYKRIKALPVRQPAAPGLVEAFEGMLRRPGGTQRLRPVQAQALFEAGVEGRGFFPITVGGGKSLISLLLPRVIECERPLLIVPAKLIEKTARDLREYNKHWLCAENLRLVSSQKLGRTTGADFLDKLQPDLLIMDEAHFAKNRRAAVTRRLHRYIHARRAAGHRLRVVVMSGTLLPKRMRQFAHILAWTHEQGAPVPLKQDVIDEWSQVLDETKDGNEEERVGNLAGVLLELYPKGGETPRQQFFARIKDTPGVVSPAGGSAYGGSLTINRLDVTRAHNDATRGHFIRLYDEAIATDGWPLIGSAEVWRVAREIALGLCYVWNPRPPEVWIEARKRWAKFVRDTVKYSNHLDSELAVANAIDRRQLDDYGTLATWRKLRPTFTIESEPRWHDDAALKACEAWLAEGDGICWVEHVFFGQELARRTGLPFFREKGRTPSGQFIEEWPGGPIIASVGSNSTGRNLQDRWYRNLITSPRPDSDWWEQLLGRTHREGQQEDGVEVDVLDGCQENARALHQAVFSAQQKRDSGQEQRLLLADLTGW